MEFLYPAYFPKNRIWVEIRNVSEFMQCDDDLHSDIYNYVYMENKRWQYEFFEMIKTQSSLSFFLFNGVGNLNFEKRYFLPLQVIYITYLILCDCMRIQSKKETLEPPTRSYYNDNFFMDI